MGFAYIEVEGDAFARGRRYGARVARAIEANVAAYLELIRLNGGLAPEAALAAARAFEPALDAYTPALLAEMRGIAEGAGCPLDHVLLINARSELMGTFGQSHGRPGGDECTALAATPGATAGGSVLLAQNWDWHTVVEPEPVLLHLHLPGRPEVLTLVEAGQVGKIGLNSAGLGVCLNFLSHVDEGLGVPVHVVLRAMLECAGLGQAIHQAWRLPRAGAANVLLAHGSGDAVDLELTATRADYLYADAGWLVHANHFESPRLRGGDLGIATSESTVARAARARRMMAAAVAAGGVTIEALQAILSDHAYGALAICRHGDPAAAGADRWDDTATRASVLMAPAEGTLHVADGQPCRAPYEAFTLG